VKHRKPKQQRKNGQYLQHKHFGRRSSNLNKQSIPRINHIQPHVNLLSNMLFKILTSISSTCIAWTPIFTLTASQKFVILYTVQLYC